MTPETAVDLAGRASGLSDKGLMLLFIGLLLGALCIAVLTMWRFNVVTIKSIVEEMKKDRITLAAEMKSDRKELGDIINRNTLVVAENTRELTRLNSNRS